MSDWQQAEHWNHPHGEEAEPSQHVKHSSRHASLTEASSWLSEHRTAPYDPATGTGCVEVHHPSLSEWCDDCSGKNARKQAEINKQAERSDFEW